MKPLAPYVTASVLLLAAISGGMLVFELTVANSRLSPLPCEDRRGGESDAAAAAAAAAAEAAAKRMEWAIKSRFDEQELTLKQIATDRGGVEHDLAGEEVTYPEEFDYDAWHQVHQERVALFRRRCRETPPIFVDKDDIYLPENFFRIDPYGLGYCHMPKTGSTTITNHLWQVYEGYRTEEEEKKVVGSEMFAGFRYMTANYGLNGTKEEILQALGQVTTFIFVRHPFVRIVSAYRMRYSKIASQIYRRFGDAKTSRHTMPPFRMFVEYFLENKQQFQNIYLPDKHLRTISGQCDVCNIGVDIVGKSETFDWDMQYLKERFGIPFQNLDLKKHVRKGDSSENLTKEWFSTLSKAQIRALYDIYQVDFVLYGYNDVQDYIDLGTD